MEKYAEISLNDFSAALASKEAGPGGGGAAAGAGALGGGRGAAPPARFWSLSS